MSGNSTKIITGLYIALLASIMLVTGCRKKNIVMPHDPYEVRFSIVSAIKPPQGVQSRAKTDENNDFTKESQIGIYATKAEEEDVRLALPENTNIGYFNPTGSTQWSVIEAGSAILFFKDEQSMNFYAYHPFTEQPSSSVSMSTDVSPTLKYKLPLNQSTLHSLTSADLMWGKKGGVSESQGVVNLEFAHKLAKMSFKITLGEGWADEQVSLSRIEIVGDKMSASGKLHISSGLFTAGALGSVTLYAELDPLTFILDPSNTQECQFITVPTDLTNIEIRVNATGSKSGELSYKATLDAVKLPAGHLRQLTMKIHKENTLNVLLAASIIPWEVISDIGMEAI